MTVTLAQNGEGVRRSAKPSKGDTHVCRVTRRSDSHVIVIPSWIRQRLGLWTNDLIVIRLVGRTMVIRKFLPEELLPLDKVEAAAASAERERLDREC